MATPLVLLHPFPLDSRFWDALRARLPGPREVVAVDFPGLGRALPWPNVSIERVADALAMRIGMIAGGRAVVCGLSMGGYVALALAARHPERCSGLVLANTRAAADTPEARAEREQSAALVRAEGTRAFLDELLPRLLGPEAAPEVASRLRAIADSQPAEAIARALEALGARPDRRPDLAAMGQRALVVAGDQDVVTPPADAQALASALPGAELVSLAGAGHLSAAEQPDAFAAALGSFLPQLP